MKLKKYLFSSLVFSAFSMSAMAGGEPVNCRTEIIEQLPIYSGQASCIASHNNFLFTLSAYVPPQSSPRFKITRLVELYSGSVIEVSCVASVPFSHYQPVSREVCDYRPSAKIEVDQFSYGEVYIKALGYDSDGTIVKKQLFIDGELQNRTSVMLRGAIGQSYLVKVIVTDDDGYESTKTQYVTIENTGVINPF
ncbi:hypothetical protein [Pleionea sp. CnH1-48]|uniref:hypothetical protein n=1 Tax=Pleionea sp. CnH1-48 TaxID=2954494 RepID=UPI00209786B3|nr:hypothetical protein [Pleionea sp. CnH1-48]MCO7226579.1 hypothetical protein [Pleionea sp. CnH1-48]